MMISVLRDDNVRIFLHGCSRAEVDGCIPNLAWDESGSAWMQIGNVDISFIEEVKHDQEGA